MRVGFAGMTHLGQTMSGAAKIRGFDIECFDIDQGKVGVLTTCDLVLVTRDVNSANDLEPLTTLIRMALGAVGVNVPVVIVSQVPLGFTRPWLEIHGTIFYQVDTIIMNCALERMLNPEQIIVGCEEPTEQLPDAYQRYLKAFNAPILRVGIEAAELAKISINFMLATQITAANALSVIAKNHHADWNEIIPALQNDKRIGKAYLKPGNIGGHLPRDVRRICELNSSPFTQSIGPLV